MVFNNTIVSCLSVDFTSDKKKVMSITLNESLNKIMTPAAVATERYVEEVAKEILMRN